MCLCIAAGNESQARHHTQGRVSAKGESQNIDVKVENSASDVFVSIWNTVSDKLAVSVTSPTGEYVEKVPPKTGSVSVMKLVLERSTVRVAYYFPMEGSGGQLTTVRILNATPGIWTVTVHGEIVLNGMTKATRAI